MILVQLVAILIGLLGVFPEGSIPMSSVNIYDNHGDVTSESIIGFFMGENSITIPNTDIEIVGISWGTILLIFTGIMLVIAYVYKNVQPLVVGVMALIMYTMYITSVEWFNNLSRSVGGVAYPSLIFIMTILGFGVLYIFVITIIESHLQGDVSDR